MRRFSLAVVVVVVAGCGDDAVHHLPDGAPASIDACDDCDGDGYGHAVDCDDSNAAIHPDAIETCDAIDDDCDGSIDELTATFDGGAGPLELPVASATATQPMSISPLSAGTLQLCGAGPYYLTIEPTLDLVVAGKGMDQTVIDGGGLVSGVTFNAAITVTVRDLAIRHGAGTAASQYYPAGLGGGMFCGTGTLHVSHVKISDSSASFGGGGLATDHCTLDLADSVIMNNTAGLGGGVLIAGGITNTITRTTISGNTATGNAGGIASTIFTAKLALVDSVVQGNSAPNGGGGMYVENTVTATCGASLTAGFLGNTGSGGVYIVGTGATFASTNCDFGSDAGTNNAAFDIIPANNTTNSIDYGADATFTCTNLACTGT